MISPPAAPSSAPESAPDDGNQGRRPRLVTATGVSGGDSEQGLVPAADDSVGPSVGGGLHRIEQAPGHRTHLIEALQGILRHDSIDGAGSSEEPQVAIGFLG